MTEPPATAARARARGRGRRRWPTAAIASPGSATSRGGRVVFVRHAMPGERVRALITEDAGGSFVRADAIEVLRAAARPGRRRPARTRVRADAAAATGSTSDPRRSASSRRPSCASSSRGWPGSTSTSWSRSCPAARCTGAPASATRSTRRPARAAAAPLARGRADRRLPARRARRRRWRRSRRAAGRATGSRSSRDDDGPVSVLAERPVADAAARTRRRRPPRGPPTRSSTASTRHRHADRRDGGAGRLRGGADGFWQVHPAAAQTFVARGAARARAPRRARRCSTSTRAPDLFTAVLARAVGPTGRVVGIEADRAGGRGRRGEPRRPAWAEVRRAGSTPRCSSRSTSRARSRRAGSAAGRRRAPR